MTADRSGEEGVTLLAMQYVFSPQAESGSIKVEAPSGMAWSATSEAQWISITAPPGGGGAGNGVVRFDVGSNSGQPRQGLIRIGDASMEIYQLAAADWLSGLVLGNDYVPAIAQTGIADLAKKLNDLPPPLMAAGYAALIAWVTSVAAEAEVTYEAFPVVPHVFKGVDKDTEFVMHELTLVLEFIAKQAGKG